MTDQRKDEMPEEIWAYITSGSNCRHWKKSEIKWGWHHQNPTKYIRTASTPSAEVMALRENIQAWRDHLSGYQAITTDVNLGIAVDVVITGMDEILNQPHTGGK